MTAATNKLATLLELVKFEHSVFALPYAYIGALFAARLYADRLPTAVELVCVTVAMVAARALAFILNRVIDAAIDARNPRTTDRAIPAGRISRAQLGVFAAVMLAAYVAALLPLPPITHWLAPVPLVCFLIYPYLKRFVPIAHYWLGLCLGLAPVGGWLAIHAVTGAGGTSGVSAPITDITPWLLCGAVMLWTAGFDIIYATQDLDVDRAQGLHSMPADIGVAAALWQTRICHVLTVALLVMAGLTAGAGVWWFGGVVVAAALLLYENLLVKPDDLSRVNTAFFTLNGFISVILGIAAVVDVLW